MPGLTATDRMRRLLAVIPWASGRGKVSLAEISQRFDYPIDRLRRDLTEVVQFVGVYPYTPDMLIEVYLDETEEVVSFELADYFTAPLRLTPEEALALVSAGLGLLDSVPGEQSALERGLNKVADRFGLVLGEQIDVRLGRADAAVVGTARDAVADRRCLVLDYHSPHRGETAERMVEPLQVFNEDGEWYMRAFCRLAEAERTFRLDRVLSMVATTESFDRDPGQPGLRFAPAEDDLRITLRLEPAAAWVAEVFPVEAHETDGDQTVVTMAVSSRVWLERLLVQLGPDATMVASEPALEAGFGARAAARVLARYQD